MFPGARALVAQNKGLRLVFSGSRNFVRKQPLIAKAMPTAIGFAFGDVLTQFMNWKNSSASQDTNFSYEWTRGAKMAAVGCLIAAPIGLGLLRWMDANVMTSNPNGLAAVSVKFTLDQVVGCILWQVAYCTIHPPYREALGQLLQSVQQDFEERSAGVKRRLQPLLALA